MPECVRAKMTQASGTSGSLQFLLYSGIGVRQFSELHRGCKNPILRRGELSCLPSDLEHVEQVVGDCEPLA